MLAVKYLRVQKRRPTSKQIHEGQNDSEIHKYSENKNMGLPNPDSGG